MKIGDLGRATGTKVETIRFYEAEGLLPEPARNAANYRVYELPHLERLSFIKRARDLGFTLDRVRELLRLADDPANSCADVDVIASKHATEIDRKLADLAALRRELVHLLGSCSGPTIADCRIIGALSPTRISC